MSAPLTALRPDCLDNEHVPKQNNVETRNGKTIYCQSKGSASANAAKTAGCSQAEPSRFRSAHLILHVNSQSANDSLGSHVRFFPVTAEIAVRHSRRTIRVQDFSVSGIDGNMSDFALTRGLSPEEEQISFFQIFLFDVCTFG